MNRIFSQESLPDLPVAPFLYDLQTAAKLMSTTLFAVRTLCRDGKLKYVQVGHKWLVSESAIKLFISAAEKTGRAA